MTEEQEAKIAEETTATAEATANQVSPEDAYRNELNEKFDRIEAELSKPENLDRGYRRETELTITGELFTSFVNINARNKVTLDAIQRNLVAAYEAIDTLTIEIARLTVELSEAHLKFIAEGKTEANSELLK